MNTRKMKQGNLGRSVATAARAAAEAAVAGEAAAAAVAHLLAVKAVAAAEKAALETGTAVGTVNIPTNR